VKPPLFRPFVGTLGILQRGGVSNRHNLLGGIQRVEIFGEVGGEELQDRLGENPLRCERKASLSVGVGPKKNLLSFCDSGEAFYTVFCYSNFFTGGGKKLFCLGFLSFKEKLFVDAWGWGGGGGNGRFLYHIVHSGSGIGFTKKTGKRQEQKGGY